MEYLFVYRGGGWWLKIDSFEKLIDYHEKTVGRWTNAFANFLKHNVDGHHISNGLTYAIMSRGMNKKSSFPDAMADMRTQVIMNQIEYLNKYGALYFNPRGGYNFCEMDSRQFVRRKELVFPSFSERDIRITKWEGGTHYYANVGDMEIRDSEGNMKWNTREEATKIAMEYINNG